MDYNILDVVIRVVRLNEEFLSETGFREEEGDVCLGEDDVLADILEHREERVVGNVLDSGSQTSVDQFREYFERKSEVGVKASVSHSVLNN